MKEIQARLRHAGGAATIGNRGEELTRLRSFTVQPITQESVSAEFFLLLGPHSQVRDVKFVGGSKILKTAGKALAAVDFGSSFPNEGPARVVRRGLLSCSSLSGCAIVLYPPGLVRSTD